MINGMTPFKICLCFSLTAVVCLAQEVDLPVPRIVIVGKTGTGIASLVLFPKVNDKLWNFRKIHCGKCIVGRGSGM